MTENCIRLRAAAAKVPSLSTNLSIEIFEERMSRCPYLWVSCEGPIPFPTNVPGITSVEAIYADLLRQMVLSNSEQPAGMLKHIGVADVLVHLAESQLCCMLTHIRMPEYGWTDRVTRDG
ncbi:hypothetical protein U9M48_013997 [Paspalum notatum var. saurae]|uniref:Uncharacterized protein n=1 Tax=Paspalum notatum var. saurae TaxID=547442 RepID=A0AAQ3T1M6_PASNO